jgi:hypothetical protein
VRHIVQRGLILLGASAISVGLTGPAFANAPQATAPRSKVVQHGAATVSNLKAVAHARPNPGARTIDGATPKHDGKSVEQSDRSGGGSKAGKRQFNHRKPIHKDHAKRDLKHPKLVHDTKHGKGDFKHPKRHHRDCKWRHHDHAQDKVCLKRHHWRCKWHHDQYSQYKVRHFKWISGSASGSTASASTTR